MREHPKKRLEALGLHAKKSLGQNFLTSRSWAERIVIASGCESGDTVVEVGPGLGAITEVATETAARVIAIELDDHLAATLADELGNPDNLEIVHADARDVSLEAYAPARLISNLPYYVSSPLVRWAVDQRKHLINATLTLQREVAERIAAEPGSKTYGALTAIVGLWADAKILFRIPPGAFYPQPEVDSSVLGLTFLDGPRAEVPGQGEYERLVFAAFSQRRKMLANCLKRAGFWSPEEVAAALDMTGIDGRRRAETLSVNELAALSVALPYKTPTKRP